MTSTQRWTLAVVCAATAMLMLDIAVVNTALSDIAADLNTGLSGLQWVVDAYTLALAAVVLTAGSLADRFGRRRLFTIGLSIFTVTSLVCAAASDIVMLNSARAAQGVGAAIMFAVSLALLSQAFPKPQERGKAFAAYGASIGAAFAIGPLVGGALTSGLDWRWIFLVNLPLGLMCLAITRRSVEESKDPDARKLDIPGQVTLTAGLFLLVLALLRGNEDGWTSAPIVAALGGAVAFLVAFIAVEARVKEPMLPLGLFRNRAFTGAQVAAFAISASFFAVFLYTTIYLQQILGLSAIEAGLVYLPGTLIMLVVSGATANLVEKLGVGSHDRRRPRDRRRRPGAADARRGRLVVDGVPPRRDRRLHRQRALQPGAQRLRAELGPAADGRPRRRRQRHVPPGRHRRGRRRAGRARARRARVRRRSPDLRGRHEGRALGRRGRLRRRRRSRAPRCSPSGARAPRPCPPSSRSTRPSRHQPSANLKGV